MDSQIYSKIEQIYNTENGKKFISHLVRAFFPTIKASFILSEVELPAGTEMKCCITNQKVFSKSELFDKIMDDNAKGLFHEKMIIAADALTGGETVMSDELKAHEREIVKIKNYLAVRADKSNRLISQVAYRELFNFITSEILKGNNHINWLIKNEKAKMFVEHGKKEGFIENRREEKVVQKVIEHSKVSLADNEVLKNLKAKFEK